MCLLPVDLGRPPRIRKTGGMLATGMLGCISIVIVQFKFTSNINDLLPDTLNLLINQVKSETYDRM